MSRNLESRVVKLEGLMRPPEQPLRLLRTHANQCGLDEEIIQKESDEEVIARHLEAHPQDAGMKFDFIRINFVHGRWNERGELICNAPECPHFNTIIKRPRTNSKVEA